MRDANDMLNVMKKSSRGVQDSSKPCAVVYGTVESVAPLKIRVDQKLLLEREHLKLTRAVLDYDTEIELNGSKQTCKILNGLKIGNKVTMIRQHGGQQYLIIDKEVS